MQPGGNDDVFGVDFEVAGAEKVAGELFAQGEDTGDRAVAIFSGTEGLFERVEDGGGGMKVRLAEFEVDDGAALAFEFLGAGEDGERAFTAHDRESAG